MPAERSNIRAGVVTLAAVGAFSAALWGWTEWKANSRADYTVVFSAEQGVYGLMPGADVLVGGIKRGSVDDIVPTVVDGLVVDYQVHVQIDRMVPVTQATRFEAVGAGINGESILEVRNVGRAGPMAGNGANPQVAGRLEPGSAIRASTPDSLRTFGGAQNTKPLRKLVDAWLPDPPRDDSLPNVVQHVIDDMPERGTAVKAGFRELSDRVRSDLQAWRTSFDELRTRSESAFAKLGAGSDAPADAIVPQLRSIGDEVGKLPSVESLRTQEASAALDRAVASAKALGRKSGELRAMLDDADTALGATSADYAIASQDLAATEREALTSPWRLFGSPNAAERARSARIEVVRAYAEAAAEHQRAMKGIEDALRRDAELLARSPGLAELLRSRVEAANERFAEQAARAEELLLGPAPVRP